MARIRTRPNYFVPNWKTGLTASEINARDSEGNPVNPNMQTDYNRAAAARYAAMRQQQGLPVYANVHDQMVGAAGDPDLADAKASQQHDYHSLANALNVSVAPVKDVWDEGAQRYVRPTAQPPTFDALKAKFLSLPADQQAKIYMAGGANFLGGDEGAKLLQGLQKTRDEAYNTGINSMVSQITRGEVTLNPQDRKFYRTVTTKDIAGNETKTKVPITLLEAQYINEGMKRGMMPDIDMFRQAAADQAAGKDTSAPVSVSPKTATTPMSLQPSANAMAPATMALTPGSSFANDDSLMRAGVRYDPLSFKDIPAPPPPKGMIDPNDPFVRAHNYLTGGGANNDLSNALDAAGGVVSDAGSALVDTAVDMGNAFTRSRNAVGRLMFGTDAYQRDLTPKLNQQPPDDPRWVAAQAEEDRNKPAFVAPYPGGF